MKVLIVDDDADIRWIVRLSLSCLGGLVVVEASGGAEGVRLAVEERPDVVLLDMMMPEMNGVMTLAALRETPETKEVPVIFLTARASAADVAQAKTLGAVGVLVKPFDARTLPAQLMALLSLDPANTK